MVNSRLDRRHGRDSRVPKQSQQREGCLQSKVDNVEPKEVAFALCKDDYKSQLGNLSSADEADGEPHHPAVAGGIALQLDNEDHQEQQPGDGRQYVLCT